MLLCKGYLISIIKKKKKHLKDEKAHVKSGVVSVL